MGEEDRPSLLSNNCSETNEENNESLDCEDNQIQEIEQEILHHFDAEPLARFVFSHLKGKIYYSSKTERFYEVNSKTNLWVESKKGDILYQKINEIVKQFLQRKIKQNEEYINTQSHLTNFTSILSKLKQEIGNKKYLDAQPDAWKPIICKLRQIDTWEKKYISKINGERLRNEIRKDIQILCKDDIFPDKLDVNLCQIAFKNGMLDLRTLTFRQGILSSD